MTRIRSLVIALGLLLTLPMGAQAAVVISSEPCYANGDKATIYGTGFAPESPISFTVNGNRIAANVTTDASGHFEAAYTPPATQTEARFVIKATDSDGTSARVVFFVTRERSVTADPSTTDNVRTWKAVFRVFGFGKGKIFIHYVGPNGTLRKTAKLGGLKGPCGKLKTKKRRVLPFANPDFGIWKLQFDTRRRYRSGTANKRVIPVRVYRG